MAINAAVDWEMRQDGNDANGGGYKRTAGTTDYSQQAAAQLSLTDLACASNTTLTSATGGFTAAMVGNVIQIASGANAAAGFYEITGRTDTNTVTIDRTCATGGNMTNGVGKVGGALASLGMASGTPYVIGNHFYIKYSATPYVVSSTTVKTSGGPAQFDTAGDGSNTQLVIGYDTTRTLTNTDANRPTIAVADAGVTTIVVIKANGSYQAFRNIIVDGKSKTSIRGFGGYVREGWFRCKAIGCTNTGIVCSSTGVALLCEADTCSVGVSGAANLFCWVHNCTSHGFSGGGVGCLSVANGGVGFSTGDGCGWTGCVAYGNTSHGFTDHYGFNPSVNCIAEANGGWGFSGATTRQIWSHCAAYNNTSGAFQGGEQISCVTITAGSVFTNAAGGDFTLNVTASQGELLRSAGFPGTFLNGSVGYVDIGLFQHADPTMPTAANVRLSGSSQYGYAEALFDGTISMPNSGTPTGTEDATSDACVVSGKNYGAGNARTGSASSGGGGTPVFGGHVVRRA